MLKEKKLFTRIITVMRPKLMHAKFSDLMQGKHFFNIGVEQRG